MYTPHSRSVGGGNAPFSLVCQEEEEEEEEEPSPAYLLLAVRVRESSRFLLERESE